MAVHSFWMWERIAGVFALLSVKGQNLHDAPFRLLLLSA
jgi:hypothetical protein